MKKLHFLLVLEVFTLLALIYGGALAQRIRINAKYLRAPHTSRQLAPYPAADQRPAVPFVLPTEQITEAPSKQAAGKVTITAKLNEKDEAADEDLAEDLDPIAADAAEDDTEPEVQISTKGEKEEEDENADIIPESRAGPSPSKRYWFFRK